ncbi:efflux RND transporter periplasmic adaptor subunit [Paracidovorax anthurii]|uniref:Multidrug efflux system membrane fusion protein n=1 Tax=Paracidovorax anthurii TaxID=78229 RepID=A0A328ZQ48_9BURK|nr:efflux RND transporter periplasmic adaptor subunit [Paracidovorax anthurii]RAR84947.1 multidrug efflux system membrane fusion protein [Paracidovorax anthurii]
MIPETPHTPHRAGKARRLAPVAAAAAALCAVFIYATASTPPAAAPKAAAGGQAVPVSVASAAQRDFPLWTEAIGTVTSLNAVNVRSRVDGQLERVAFTEGQMVHRGDLLAQIDARPLQAQVNQSKAQLAQEEARLASNKVDLQRATDLAAAGAGSAQAVDTLRATVATQAAVVQAAQAALESAQLQLGFTRITSPIDGRVGQRLQPAGSTVHANDATGIATVTQMNPIWVAFSVPQDQLPAVTVQSRARALKVQALLRDRSKVLADGELEFVDSQVSPAAGQVQLKARFANAERSLWPGQLVSIRMLLANEAGATVVPQEAVQQGPKGAFVYVVDGAHMAQARQIDAGPAAQGLQWVRKGLQPGEVVVTQGQYRIAPGVPVTTAAAGPGATASSTSAGNP